MTARAVAPIRVRAISALRMRPSGRNTGRIVANQGLNEFQPTTSDTGLRQAGLKSVPRV
jgi:hypothetical protein